MVSACSAKDQWRTLEVLSVPRRPDRMLLNMDKRLDAIHWCVMRQVIRRGERQLAMLSGTSKRPWQGARHGQGMTGVSGLRSVMVGKWLTRRNNCILAGIRATLICRVVLQRVLGR
jgi:hypothetical protein